MYGSYHLSTRSHRTETRISYASIAGSDLRPLAQPRCRKRLADCCRQLGPTETKRAYRRSASPVMGTNLTGRILRLVVPVIVFSMRTMF
jgi:hypothetical protein